VEYRPPEQEPSGVEKEEERSGVEKKMRNVPRTGRKGGK
jgi:hypothetical protein